MAYETRDLLRVDYLQEQIIKSTVEVSTCDDIKLLELREEVKSYPEYAERVIQLIEDEIEARDLFEPSPTIRLEERTDAWLAQRRYDIKGEISNLKREDELLKAERDSIDQEFERRLKSRGSTATKAGGFTITLKEDDKYPMIGDHTVFETYVLDTKKLHLLQKRLSMTSIQEELAAMRAEQTALRTQLVEAQTKEDINSIFAKVKEFISHNAITNISLRNPNSFSRTEDLKVYLDELLDTVYQIPGISLVTHITLNQTKRGS